MTDPVRNQEPNNPASATVPQGIEIERPMTRWERSKFVFRGIEVRLRFIAIFVGIGLLMAYWPTLENYWDRWTRPGGALSAISADSEFYCPMHPSVVRDTLEPNGELPECPICGMPLSKRKKGEIAELPDGVLARLQLTPERIQLAGVQTVAASYMPLAAEVRTVGYVQYDESRLADIVTRVGGYIEKLYVDKTYATVEADQALAEIYSPDLYSTAQELLLAQKHGANELIGNARQRLTLLGVNDAEIDEILSLKEARAQLLIRSPQAGLVVEKNIVAGASVEAGSTLFKIADLSTVWIEADVYERDLAIVRPGQDVEATVEAYSGKTFPGKIALVYPQLNAATRTNRIRVVLENIDRLLRPGMFATVVVKSPVSETEPFKAQLASLRNKPLATDDQSLIKFQKNCPVTGRVLGSMGTPVKSAVSGTTVFLCCEGCLDPLQEDGIEYLARLAPPPADTVLSVPERAVIDTGTQQIVYVEREPGLFEGVAVKIGPRSGNFYPVLEGLAVGDKVVASGSFLLDAETRLNPAAASAFFGAVGQDRAGNGTGDSKASSRRKGNAPSAADLKNIGKLSPEDQKLALAQGTCPVAGEALGSMGVPIKIELEGQLVFVCCKACLKQARENPSKVLEKVKPPAKAEPRDRAAMGSPSKSGHQH